MDPQGLNGSQTKGPSTGGNPPPAAGASAEPGDAGSGAAPRPEWVPEAHWNAEAGALNLESFGKHYGEIAARDKAEQDRLAALPTKAEDVKFTLPEGAALPEGMAIDEKNPLFTNARDLVVNEKIDPAIANKFFGLYVKSQAAEFAVLNDRLNAEKAKLGEKHAERVDALDAGLRAAIGEENTKALIGDVSGDKTLLFSAAQVKALESLLKLVTTQGATAPGAAAHNVPSPPPKSRAEILYPNIRKAS